MPFKLNKIIDAVVQSANTLNDLDNGLTTSELLFKIGQHLGVRKCKIRALRAHLDFMWKKNEKKFRDIVTERVLCKSFSGSVELTPPKSSSQESKPSKSKSKNVKKKSKNPRVSKKLKKKFIRLIKVMRIKTSRITKHRKVCPDRLHLELRKKLPVTQPKLTCCLTFNGFKLSKNPDTPFKFWDYAYCGQPKCYCKFKIVGPKKDDRYTLIRVYVARQYVPVHTLPLNYQLRGRRRQKIKALLRYVMPARVHADQFKVINEPLAKTDKNYMFTHSLPVHHTARYEELGKNDADTDDTLDIVKRMLVDNSHEHPFIRRFITPFTIYLACAEQIEFLKENPGLVLHFDATGSIIKKPYPESKRVYLYSGVVVKSNKILALLHMVTNEHYGFTVRDLFIYFKDLWIRAGIEWPPFEAVVVDWSWASINGILSAWNNTDILNYLRAVYANLTKGIGLNLITIHLCYGHFMKMISKFLYKNQVHGRKKQIIMEGMAVLCHCKCITDLRLRVTDLGTILLSKRKSEKILSAVKNLSCADITNETCEVPDNNFETDDDDNNSSERLFDCEIDQKRPVYASSPFFEEFNGLLSDLEISVNRKDLNENTEENEYYCMPFIVYLNKKLLPYAPLWTGLLIKNPNIDHYSNAYAEISFKIIKESVCENLTHAKAGRVIDKLHDHALSTAIELRVGPSSQHIKTRKRSASVDKSETAQSDDLDYSKNSKIPKTDPDAVTDDVDDVTVIQSSSTKLADNGKQRKSERRINEPGNMSSIDYWRRRRPTGKSHKKSQDASTLKTIAKSKNEFASNTTNNTRTVECELHHHPNGTVANKNYYFAPDVRREYLVGVVPKSPEERDYYRYLRGEDYNTLFGRSWITNMVIDYCYSWLTLEILPNSNRYAYVVSEISSKFIGRGELADVCDEFKAKCKREWSGKDRLLFSINVFHQHFILMYVDIAAKVTYLFDPATKSGERYHARCHANFVKMFGIIFGTESAFERGICKYPYRADGYNCGIFVIHYIQQILSHHPELKIDPVSPDQLRVMLQHDCVVKSSDVRERCLRCGCAEESRRDELWVGCDCCQKWTHFSCLTHLEKTPEEIQDSSYKYICDLCTNWMQSE